MIQDIFPHIYHNEYKDITPRDEDYLLIFHQNTVLIRYQKEKLRYPTMAELRDFPITCYYLFSVDERPYFLGYPSQTLTEVPSIMLPGYSYENVSLFRTALSRHNAFAGITGHHLFEWYQSNQFCGRCGSRLLPDHKERMLFCPSCSHTVYPRISPAVIVGVVHKDKILMSKYAGGSYRKYALIAGFTEIGESVEQTVSREVMEEVGLRVKNIQYYKSQPWAFSGSLLMGFFAQLDGSDQITLDKNELSEAGWFSREEITLKDDHVSLTREMIQRFKSGAVLFR